MCVHLYAYIYIWASHRTASSALEGAPGIRPLSVGERKRRAAAALYIYIYIHIHVCVCVYITYIHLG